MPKKPVLFTPGPVMMGKTTLRIGGRPLPYFRTARFSAVVRRCEKLFLKLLGAGPGHRWIPLAASGTGALEAAVTHLFGPRDKVLILNGGPFGARLAEIARFHGLAQEEIETRPGSALRPEALAAFAGKGFTGLLAVHHETTSGELADIDLLDRFCRKEKIPLLVDAISSFLSDPLSLKKNRIDAVVLSSQKSLALPPGLSFVVLSPRAVRGLGRSRRPSYYFDLPRYLKDLKRGQTPFTPAVGLLLQLEDRLEALNRKGEAAERARVSRLAADFRRRIIGLPFRLFAQNPSNAVTALSPTDGTPASWYVERLREDDALFVCPNGGVLRDHVFRVGHLGALTPSDNARLASALKRLSQAKSRRKEKRTEKGA